MWWRFGADKMRNAERGGTLFVVAGSLTVLLGIGAIAIDIASLYVARSECQRTADAAALAGAKVFVESGCVTSGDCSGAETKTAAIDRATQVALQNLVQGQPVTVSGVSFTETAQNPQITVQIQSPALHVYFAGAVGITSAPTVGASATAEAYNPSGVSGGPAFCTGCVRPWLVSNCDPDKVQHPGPSNSKCGPGIAYLLSSDGHLVNPGCYPGGVIGESLKIALGSNQAQFGAVDDGTGPTGYQKSIATCNTGQMTCGTRVNTLPGPLVALTTPGIDTLLHLTGGSVGPGQGQDTIDTSVCPPRIHAGSQNPLVPSVLAASAPIATSDSVVTAYLYDYDSSSPLTPGTAQTIRVRGFVQIFVTQVDTNGDVWGVVLGLAGCSTSDADGDCDPGSMKGSTLLPVRLITPAGG